MSNSLEPISDPSASPTRFERLFAAVLRALRYAQVDRAVAYSIANFMYQAITGMVTLIMTPLFFSANVQGYYYTFLSLLSCSALMELGMSIAIINTASHEWADLKLSDRGQIQGKPEAISRLASLGQQVFRWYGGASLIFWPAISITGYFFFSQSSANTGVSWLGPWLCLTFLTSLALWAMPFLVILEGCGQLAKIYEYRLKQAPLVTAAMWISMAMGLGLWSIPISNLVGVSSQFWILLVRYRHFWAPFFKPATLAKVTWKTEIWPMQWRLALSTVSGFLAFYLYNPVIFHYHGAAEAGRMGMTLQMVAMLQGIGMAWAQVRTPQFGVLIARREYKELDRLFFRSTASSLSVVCLGGVVLWGLIWLIHWSNHRLSDRLVLPLPAAMLIVHALLMQISYCQSFYLRAHKREPLMPLSVASGVMQGLLIWWWGAMYGSIGQAAASLLVVSVIILPWETTIWIHARRHWHV